MHSVLFLIAFLAPADISQRHFCDVDLGSASVTQLMTTTSIPRIDIAVINNSEVTYTGSCALTDEDKDKHLFNVASLAKPVFAVLVMQLVEQGLWELDAPLELGPIAKTLSDHPWASALTTRNILAHRSGLPNWRSSKELEFLFEPGTQLNYSGEGFELLQRAIEHQFGKSLQTLAEEFVFAPFGLSDTHYSLVERKHEQRIVPWYDNVGTLHPMHDHDSASAADNLLASIDDYGKFIESVMSGANLGKERFNDMLSPQGSPTDKFQMGLGWELIDLTPHQRIFLHSGSDKGTNTLALFSLETGEGLVIFTNSDNGKEAFAPLIHHYLSFAEALMKTG